METKKTEKKQQTIIQKEADGSCDEIENSIIEVHVGDAALEESDSVKITRVETDLSKLHNTGYSIRVRWVGPRDKTYKVTLYYNTVMKRTIYMSSNLFHCQFNDTPNPNWVEVEIDKTTMSDTVPVLISNPLKMIEINQFELKKLRFIFDESSSDLIGFKLRIISPNIEEYDIPKGNPVLDLSNHEIKESVSFEFTYSIECKYKNAVTAFNCDSAYYGLKLFYFQITPILRLSLEDTGASDYRVSVNFTSYQNFKKSRFYIYEGERLIWSKEDSELLSAIVPNKTFDSVDTTKLACSVVPYRYSELGAKENIKYSCSSMGPVPLIFDTPSITRVVFNHKRGYCIYVEMAALPYPFICIRNHKNELTVLQIYQENEEQYIIVDIIKYPIIQLAYIKDVSIGRFCAQLDLRLIKKAYYLYTDTTLVVCRSDDMMMNKGVEIKIEVLFFITPNSNIGSGCFSLKKAGEQYNLILNSSVWRFAGGGIRDNVKNDFQDFLVQLENAKMPVSQIEAIRQLAVSYLPQNMEKFWFYHGRYANNFVELFNNEVLRVDFESYQQVGEPSLSEDGYVSSGVRDLELRERDGKLCMDPFTARLTGGKYIPDLKQPSYESGLCAPGGGGVIDLMSEGMRREYLGIIYPAHLLAAGGMGMAHAVKNPVLLAASARKELWDGVVTFRRTGAPPTGVQVGYLRGRAHMTCCISVTVNGIWKKVEFGTTLMDLLSCGPENITNLIVMRMGLEMYRLTGLEEDWMKKLLLFSGDEISWDWVRYTEDIEIKYV